MGSWNACCGISKLPIQVGDPVVDFFIGEVGIYRDSGFICYSNDLWAPLTIQTYGVYDDYGQIREEPGWHVDYVVKVLKDHLIELEQGENKYHDISVKRDEMTFEFAQEAIHEGRLFVHKPNWITKGTDQIRVSRMMVHRFVFDAMVSWGFQYRFGIANMTSLIESGSKFAAKVRQEEADMASMDDDLRQMSKLMHQFDRSHRERDDAFVGSFTESESGDLFIPHKFKSYLRLLEGSVSSPDIDSMIMEMAKFILFRANFSEMQFLWTPQTGSQDYPYESLSKLYNLCNEHIQIRMQDYDEG